MSMNRVKARTKLVSTAVVLGGLGALVLNPLSASAAIYTFDCWPGVSQNLSSPDPCTGKSNSYGYVSSDGGAIGYGDIIWNADTGNATIQGWTLDRASDGKGPVVKMVADDGYGGTQIAILHNTRGTSTTQAKDEYTFHIPNRFLSNGITIQMCNGLNSVGSAQNCSEVHGPFHA